MRIDPSPSGSERELLCGYLDYQRETVLLKTNGLDQEQMNRSLPPSTLTLGGLLYHLALVEESWMEVRFLGQPERTPWIGVDWDADPNWEFRTSAAVEPDALRQRYREACERSRNVVAQAADLGQQSANPLEDGRPFTLRWVLLHLIEETARHAGHADYLRESIDGNVGESGRRMRAPNRRRLPPRESGNLMHPATGEAEGPGDPSARRRQRSPRQPADLAS